MITPKDIETKEFTSTKGGGYKGDEVDQFLDEILVDYAHLLEERNALKNKVNLLTEKLNEMASAPAPEPVVVEAPVQTPAPVVITQAPSEDMESARKKAQRLVADAEEYAKKLIETAQYEANRQNAITQKLTAEIEAFKNSLLDTYAKHVKTIEEIPNMQFEDVKIGSETLDILNQSLSGVPSDEGETPVPADEDVSFVIPAQKTETVPEEPTLIFDDIDEKPVKKTAAKRASKGLEDLFDEDDLKKKKKDTKKKKKLFFRDDDDDDDDFFDDDDDE